MADQKIRNSYNWHVLYVDQKHNSGKWSFCYYRLESML